MVVALTIAIEEEFELNKVGASHWWRERAIKLPGLKVV